MTSTIGLLVAFCILLPLGIAAASLAPWVPTGSKDFTRIQKAAQLKPNEVFYELGSGDGRVCRYMAKHNPKANVVGIELAYPLYLYARLLQLIKPYSNLRFIYGDALKQDLSQADVLYVYGLIRTMNEKVKPKLLKELKPGARAISYHFQIQDWPGTATSDVQGAKAPGIHCYTR